MGELIKNKAKSTVIGKGNEKCNQEGNRLNIRTLEIDFDKGILKCNEKSYTERPVIVTLPGPDDNFK